ncbi:phosphatase PAP2 family protein [Maribacter sp. MAR_2009_72]|uniref:phosphatase PAP2 family protein n=1 Tax=Maribacter sp. MAR_2009_72 TaxID=1250050 RepID=UPI00119C071F|nr:phosphatase PAP2 family protein [Maribacter sp. MAR_2009_72]TVZ15210.1 undecaprenyl-diphosphatase [Maribacter sp. MAR_2009_72]
MLDSILQWDRDAFIYLNNLGEQPYDFFWSTVTKYPPWIPLFLGILILFFIKYPKREALTLIVTLLVMVFFVETLTNLVKQIVARPRPNNDEDLKMMIRIVKNPSSYSFFSAHAAISFSIMTFVTFCLRKYVSWVVLGFIWPVLFIMSRIYLGVHYPLDLLAGALFGALSAYFFFRIYHKLISPYLK